MIRNISAKVSFEMLKDGENSHLIDVRTLPEWNFVGVPYLDDIGKEVIFCSFKTYPNMEINQDFVNILLGHFNPKLINKQETKLLFLCKIGGRSYDAAMLMQQAGFKHCYNIEYGFEGDLDKASHRSNINGWKAEGLPWRQI